MRNAFEGLATESKQVDQTTALAAIRDRTPTTAPQQGAGAVTPATLRVTTATDSPEVANTAAMKTSLQSIDSKLPAGIATQATLAELNTAVGAPADAAATDDTGSASLLARVKRLSSQLVTMSGKLPAAGAASEATLEELNTAVGTRADAAATDDTAAVSLLGRIKRLGSLLASLVTLSTSVRDRLPAAGAASETTLASLNTAVGAQADAAAADDTAAASLLARLKRIGSLLTNLGTLTTGVRDRLPAAGAASETTLASLNTAVGAQADAAAADDTAAASLMARLKRIGSLLANLGTLTTGVRDRLPATGAASETTLASLNTATGARADTAATDDTGTFSLIAFVKRLCGLAVGIRDRLPATGVASQTTLAELNTAVGAQADAAAADDTGTASLSARFKRLSQQLVVMSGKLPSSLGAKSAVNSLSVTQDTDSTLRVRTFQPTLATGSAIALAAGVSSAAQAAAAGTVIRYGNSFAAPITIEFGNSSVVAGAASLIEVMPGSAETFTVPAGATHFACFCAQAATLKWMVGTGS